MGTQAGSFVDVIVIGGGAAGLAAALQLGRMRSSVVVIDAGEPRNAPAAHLHGYLGHDGAAPAELLAAGRAEVSRYGVELVEDRVLDITGDATTGFTVSLASGRTRSARRILLATGLTDSLPAIEGLAERWGRQVIHCPYCHGWEVRDQRIVVIDTAGLGTHQALLFRQLSDRVELVVHAGAGPDATQRAQLEAFGIGITGGPVLAVSDGHGGLILTLSGGATLDADAVVVAPTLRPNVAPVSSLGLTVAQDPSGIGSAVVTDAMGATDVAGVYAAGNIAQPMQQLLHAAAHGSAVAAAINVELLHSDVAAAVSTTRPTD